MQLIDNLDGMFDMGLVAGLFVERKVSGGFVWQVEEKKIGSGPKKINNDHSLKS